MGTTFIILIYKFNNKYIVISLVKIEIVVWRSNPTTAQKTEEKDPFLFESLKFSTIFGKKFTIYINNYIKIPNKN